MIKRVDEEIRNRLKEKKEIKSKLEKLIKVLIKKGWISPQDLN